MRGPVADGKTMPLRSWDFLAPPRGGRTPHRKSGAQGLRYVPMNTLLLIIVLLLLFGGGGFYIGGPAFGGGGIGLILLICLIIYLMGGFGNRKSG